VEVVEHGRGDARKLAQQAAVVQEEGADALGKGEHPLPVGDVGHHLVGQPLGPHQHLALMARGAQVARLARVREEVLLVAVGAADAGKAAGAQDAALGVRPDEALDVDRQAAVRALVAVAVDRHQRLEVVDEEAVRGALARVPPTVSLDAPAAVRRHAVPVRDADALVGDNGPRGRHGPLP